MRKTLLFYLLGTTAAFAASSDTYTYVADKPTITSGIWTAPHIATSKNRFYDYVPAGCVDKTGASYPVDGGVCIQDSAGHQFQLAPQPGPLHLTIYDPPDGASASCLANRTSCDQTAVFATAFAASALFYDGGVVTDGQQIVANTGNIYVPPNGYLKCGLATQGGGVNQFNNASYYWNQPNTLVINPAFTVYRDATTNFESCRIIPDWYTSVKPATFSAGTNAVPTNPHDMFEQLKLMQGTATIGSGTGARMSNIFAVGFDVCFDQNSSGATEINNPGGQCNVQMWDWGQRAGMKVEGLQRNVALNQRLSLNGTPLNALHWQITGTADDGTGQIKYTVNNTFNAGTVCAALSACISPGGPLIGTGLATPSYRASTNGQVDTTTTTITNVPHASGNGQDGIESVQTGAKILDAGTGGCLFSGIVVRDKDVDNGIVFLSGMPTGCSPNPSKSNEALTFINSSSGPAGGNTRTIAGAVDDVNNTVVGLGTSYAGPVRTLVNWDAGTSTLRVYDTRNIFDNQYVCSSGGSGPFCAGGSIPAAFASTPTTSSTINSLGASNTGTISVGSNVGWPLKGIVVTSISCVEEMAYHIPANSNNTGLNPTNIVIDARNWDNLGSCTHANSETLAASTAQVQQIVPDQGDTSETPVVIVNMVASVAGVNQTLHFSNDNVLSTGLSAELVENFTYATFSAVPHAVGPFQPIVAVGTTTNNNANLTNVENGFYIQPGMVPNGAGIPADATPVTATAAFGIFSNILHLTNLSGTPYKGMQVTGSGIQNDSIVSEVTSTGGGNFDLTISHRTTKVGTSVNVTIDGIVVTAVSGTTVTMNANATGSHTGELIQFSGCGWPAGQPFLGNCQAALMLNGSLTDQASQGTIFIWPHGGQVANQVLNLNSPALTISEPAWTNGAGKGAQIDPFSVCIDIAGKVTNTISIQNGNCSGSAFSIFMDLQPQSNGIKLSHMNLGTSGGTAWAVLGAGAGIILDSLDVQGPGVNYYSHQVANLTVSNNIMPSVSVYTDLATSPTPQCSNNNFLTPPCESTTFVSTIGTNPTSLSDFSLRHLSLLDFQGSDPSGVADSTVAIQAAFAAALANNIHEVWADGKPGVGATYKLSTVTIPAGIALKCPGPLPQAPLNFDFRKMPGFIVTNTHGFVNTGGSIDNCTVIQTALNAAPPVSLQDFQARKAGYTGFGIQCTVDPCGVTRNLIVGFDSPIYVKGARGGLVIDNRIDGNWCFNVPSQPGGGLLSIRGNVCNSYGTGSGSTAITTINLSGFSDNGSGELHGAYASTCNTTNCPLNGYLASVIQPPSAQSAGGEHNLENVSTSGFDLVGTTSAFLTGFGVTATTTSGSTLVTGFTTHLDQFKKGQNVTGATCIPASDQIAAFFYWNNQGYMELTAPATCTVTETITTTDDAATTVGVTVATINVPGTCYTVGDLETVNGGTLASGGTPAVLVVTAVTPDAGCSDTTTGTPIPPLGISDPGLYTTLPGSGATTTGGTGTGLTVDVGSTSQLVVDSALRPQPYADIINVNDVSMDGNKELYHAIGIKTSGNASGVNVDHCDLHDNNYDGARRIGLWISGNSKAVTIHCNTYYAGVALLYDRTSPTSVGSANTVSGFLGGSVGNTTGQNELFEIHSTTQGTPGKGDLILQDVYSRVGGVGFFGDDASGGTLNAVRLPQTTSYAQSAATAANWCGAGNSFAPGSMPIYSVCDQTQIKPGASFGNGGTTLRLTNTSSTYTPYANNSFIIDSAVLTNNRNLTLSNTNATDGYPVYITRKSSSGGFNRVVKQADGTTTVATIADGADATIYFDVILNLWVQF